VTMDWGKIGGQPLEAGKIGGQIVTCNFFAIRTQLSDGALNEQLQGKTLGLAL
jgi:hypothetical protein